MVCLLNVTLNTHGKMDPNHALRIFYYYCIASSKVKTLDNVPTLPNRLFCKADYTHYIYIYIYDS